MIFERKGVPDEFTKTTALRVSARIFLDTAVYRCRLGGALQTISDKLKDVDFSKFVTDAELSQELAAYVKDADLKKKVGGLLRFVRY